MSTGVFMSSSLGVPTLQFGEDSDVTAMGDVRMGGHARRGRGQGGGQQSWSQFGGWGGRQGWGGGQMLGSGGVNAYAGQSPGMPTSMYNRFQDNALTQQIEAARAARNTPEARHQALFAPSGRGEFSFDWNAPASSMIPQRPGWPSQGFAPDQDIQFPSSGKPPLNFEGEAGVPTSIPLPQNPYY